VAGTHRRCCRVATRCPSTPGRHAQTPGGQQIVREPPHPVGHAPDALGRDQCPFERVRALPFEVTLEELGVTQQRREGSAQVVRHGRQQALERSAGSISLPDRMIRLGCDGRGRCDRLGRPGKAAGRQVNEGWRFHSHA
jgi:hypothetical protein